MVVLVGAVVLAVGAVRVAVVRSAVLKRKLRVQLTHDTKSERGSVVSLRFIFTTPPEGKKIDTRYILLV